MKIITPHLKGFEPFIYVIMKHSGWCFRLVFTKISTFFGLDAVCTVLSAKNEKLCKSAVKIDISDRNTMTSVCVCVSVRVCVGPCVSGQVKGPAVTVTCSLWNQMKLCVWDAGSQGHGLSPVPTTQRLCPPPSINRDSHSYTPPIHQSSLNSETERENG